jgi:hypothetical protein
MARGLVKTLAEYQKAIWGHSVALKLTKDNSRFYASITTIPRPDIELDPLLKGTFCAHAPRVLVRARECSDLINV